MPPALRPCRLAGLCLLLPSLLPAAIAPHPTLPDRLVETRDELVVEYSPGHEAWAEEAFRQLRALAGRTPTAESTADVAPAQPGGAEDMRTRRDAYLAAVAAHVGLDAPTDLQARTYDVFVGHYAVLHEHLRLAFSRMIELLDRPPRRVTLWQSEDLKARLQAGQAIPDFSYDPTTDSATLALNFEIDADQTPAVRAIRETIAAQRLDHEFTRDARRVRGGVRPGRPTSADAPPAPPTSAVESPPLPDFTYPIVWSDDDATSIDPDAFRILTAAPVAVRHALLARIQAFRDPATALIVLHETAEVGLVGSVIASPDRRWLCDGTANYVAWRVLRDLADPHFAAAAYDLPRLLRRCADYQAEVDLAGWAAAEHKDGPSMPDGLLDAHYAFATRAMFLIAERHGDCAIADLWREVARTPREAVTAQSFATAYRALFQADLASLLAEAQSAPLPPSAAATPDAPLPARDMPPTQPDPAGQDR
ncbi:MAG: hypothetical protein IAE82_04450 [Opitutaceae bacterium]|nr:hypothetical protein [Opitutaceae bacterium]